MKRLQAYDNYQPVQLNFAKELPNSWKILRGKFIFSEVNERSIAGIEQLLSVSEHKGIVPRDSIKVTMFQAANYADYKLCEQGDVVINSLWAWHRGIGVSEYAGIVSTAYSVHRLQKPGKWNHRYLNYLLRTPAYVGEYLIRSKGIWDSRLQLTGSNFLDVPIIIPPLETQNTIVAYLDKKTSQIQDFIRKKEWLIELLEEERSRTIERLVTKGLNDNVNMKSSGNEWIGDIPEHWQVKRLGAFGRFFKGGGISRAELTEFGIAAILYGDIYTKYNFSIQNIINRISKETAKNSIKLQYGNLLFTGSGETIEEIGKCVAFLSEEDTYAGGDVIIYRQNTNDSLFLSYALNTTSAIFQKARMSKGDIIVHTYASKLKNVYIALPPINEQKEIVEAIKSSINKIESLIVKAKTEIEKTKEYQESLITNVVTGKLKVPELNKQTVMS